MGSFTSFLCCGGDNTSDTDDKHPRRASTRSSPTKTGNVTRSTNPSNAANTKKAPGASKQNGTVEHVTQKTASIGITKPALDDDNSVNESDTLTVPNDESTKLDSTKTEAPDSHELGNPNKPVVHSETVASVPENTAEPEQFTEKSNLPEETSSFDLSAIQENQSFDPETGFLLGKKDIKRFGKKKCLVLDLDETLVHSSFKYLRTADFVIPVEIEDQVHHVYVIKRPGVDEFLRKVGQWYEVVVFTASVAKYGDPLLNKLDIHHAVHQRLFRDSCYSFQGNFIKNLSQLGRPLRDSIIIDNSPASYIFHPQHSVPISSWFSDTHDNELLDLLPLLEDLSRPNVDDVSLVLDITI